ncbi:MAG: universal stress protein [Bacteroidia bacterium]|nr:universal stress protein [Bacteroidia bacterium]
MPSTHTNRRLDTREIRSILVPTDFSDTANHAFIYAANLAWTLQARLVAMHAFYTSPVAEGVAPADFMEKIRQEKITEAQAKFDLYKADIQRLFGSELLVEYKIEPGDAIDHILTLSQNSPIDLIVMGTLGQESIAENILGSVTSRVIGRASCPVLAIPKGVRYQPIRHILFATNLEETDSVVVDQLLSYADLFGASISCVHVHTPDDSGSSVDLSILENLYSAEINAKKVSFEVVNDHDIVRGLHHYVVTHQVDLVTLLTHRNVHNPEAFQKGLTRAFSLETDVPLLAFHEDK